MAINDFLKRDINRLVVPTSKKSGGLPARKEALPIVAQRGVGSASLQADTATIRKQVIAVYSILIITSDGAFERPAGWPTNGDYPAGTPTPTNPPDSLIIDGSTVSLDVGVQYYEQKRVHWVAYERDTTVDQDWMLVTMAMPYVGKGQYLGLDSHVSSNFHPTLYYEYFDNGNAAVTELVNELEQQGITSE